MPKLTYTFWIRVYHIIGIESSISSLCCFLRLDQPQERDDFELPMSTRVRVMLTAHDSKAFCDPERDPSFVNCFTLHGSLSPIDFLFWSCRGRFSRFSGDRAIRNTWRQRRKKKKKKKKAHLQTILSLWNFTENSSNEICLDFQCVDTHWQPRQTQQLFRLLKNTKRCSRAYYWMLNLSHITHARFKLRSSGEPYPA